MGTWKDELPEDLQASPALQDVQDVTGLAKQFVDLQSHLGTSIRIPSEDAGEEDRKAFLDKLVAKVPELLPRPKPGDEMGMSALLDALGRPKKPEEYQFPEVENLDVSADKAAEWQKLAHEAGLTPDQFNKLLTPLMKKEADKVMVSNKALKDGLDALKEEWGAAHEGKMSSIKLLLEQYGAPAGMVEGVTGGKISADMLKFLDSIASGMSNEGGEIGNQGKHDKAPAVTATEAAQRAAEIRRRLTARDAPAPNSKEYQALLDELVKFEGLAKPSASRNINDLRAGFSASL